MGRSLRLVVRVSTTRFNLISPCRPNQHLAIWIRLCKTSQPRSKRGPDTGIIMQASETLARKNLDQAARNIVVKVGSKILTREGRVDEEQIQSLASQLSTLANQGRHVCLVSSGAIGTAMTLLDTDRPAGLGELQAYAAIGQAELIHLYNQEFEKHGKRAAQVLLTIEDMNHRRRYLNLRNTIFSLFELQAIPVINENDCVATDEIAVTFGDNDQLAANVAMLVDADLLIILSDVEALYDRSPEDPEANQIGFIDRIDDELFSLASGDSQQGRAFSKGGMASKLTAAQTVASVGIPAVIAGGRTPEVLKSIIAGESVGSLVSASENTTTPRKRWIRSTTEVTGTITIDEGAVTAIRTNGKSLLPIGVTAVTGEFRAGDTINVKNSSGELIAKGISNFSNSEAESILGCRSRQAFEILGRVANEELIHRDNLVVV